MLSPPNRLCPLALSIIIACCPSVGTAGFRVLDETPNGSSAGPRAAAADRYFSPIPNVVLSFQGRSNQLTPKALRDLLDFVRNAAPSARYAIVAKGNRTMPESTMAGRVGKTRQALSEFGIDPTRFALSSGPDYEDELPTPFVRVFIVPAHLVTPEPQVLRPVGAGNMYTGAQAVGAGQPSGASALSNSDVQVEIANRLIAISQQGKLEPQTALMLLQNFLARPGQEGAAAAQPAPPPVAPAAGRRPADVEPHWRNADASPNGVQPARMQKAAAPAAPMPAYESRGSVRHASYRDGGVQPAPLSSAAFAALPSSPFASPRAMAVPASYQAEAVQAEFRPQRGLEAAQQQRPAPRQSDFVAAVESQRTLPNLAAAPGRTDAATRVAEAATGALQASGDESDAVDVFFGIQRKPSAAGRPAINAFVGAEGTASPAAGRPDASETPITLAAAAAALAGSQVPPASALSNEIPTVSIPGNALEVRGSSADQRAETAPVVNAPAPAYNEFKVSPYLVASMALPAFPDSAASMLSLIHI